MIYAKENKWIDKYEYAGINQHGVRFKQVSQKCVKVVTLSAKIDNAGDLFGLIALSDQLGVPVHWDSQSKPQQAYIKLVSAEAI